MDSPGAIPPEVCGPRRSHAAGENKKRLVAAELPHLLRAAFQSEQELCQREPDFVELYSVFGDFKKQERIRLANPEKKHCELLKKNPRACNGCPFNPYEKPGGVGLRMLAEEPQLVDQSILIERQFSMGLLPVEEMLPATMEVIRVTQEELRRLERWEQAKMIASEMATILSKMFGQR